MSTLEGFLLWPGMFGYLAVVILYLTSAIFGTDAMEKWAWRIFVISFLLQTSSILWRWSVSGRMPVMVSYEHYQLGSWFIGLVMFLGGAVYKPMRIIALGAAAVMLLMLGVGVGTESTMDPLRPPFRSNWLFIHIGFAWFAWGFFVVASVLAGVYLVKRPGRPEGRLTRKFPSRKIMDELMMKQILFGFICQGLMIIAGAIWAHQLWGRYWAWDPIETWSLVCWLVYGLVLHFRLVMNWKGDRMAVMVLLALLTAIVYFWGIGFMPASHTTLMLFD